MIQARIYLENLKHNLQQIRNRLPEKTLICAAVKANGYGHGYVPVARFLKSEGVSHLAIARVWEARKLRLAGIDGPLLLFGYCDPAEIPELVELNVSPFAGDREYLHKLAAEGQRQQKKVSLHLTVDTGMGRIGCLPEEALNLARMIADHPFLEQQGLCTHFPVSDSPLPENQEFTKKQQDQLYNLAEEMKAQGLNPGLIHNANSGAIISQDNSLPQMVRPGIMLYGYAPDLSLRDELDLKPVMQLECHIAYLKKVAPGTTVSYGRTWTAPEERWIATLPVGYADGYNRRLSNRAEVWIKGRRFPVVGRVCMDQIMVDLGPETDLKTGDPVVIFGPQPGAPDAWELAELLDTIPYEITCGISHRVPRVYP